MRLIDLTGKEVKNWVVESRVPNISPVRWKCRCKVCGKYKVIFAQLLRDNNPGPCWECGANE